jgi:hypothetical protein
MAARSGNADAIAQLIGRAFAEYGLSVSGTVTDDQLNLTVVGDPLPEQQQVIPLIKTGLMRLGFGSIRTVVLQAQTTTPADGTNDGWIYRFQINDALNSPPTPQPDAASLVKVHGGTPTRDNALRIGSYRIHDSAHGHVIHPDTEPVPSLRRRSPPTAAQFCDPLPSMLDRQPETQDALSALLSDQVVEFYGEHGLGKSAILCSLAHAPQVRRQFMDGISYRRVATRPLEDVWQDVFAAFYEWEGAPSVKPTPSELHAALRSLNGLAVLDDLPPGSVSWVKDSGMTVLLSSDEHQLTDIGQAMPMRGLPIPEAVTLIEQRLGRSLVDSAERHAAEAIGRFLKGHPLRIIQTVSFLQTFHRASANTDLPSTLPQLLEQLRAGPSAEALTIRAATTLPELERRVLAVLAVFEHISLAPEHLSVLVGSSNLDLTVQILLERGLMSRDRDGYRLASNLLPYFRKIWNLTPWIDRSITYFTAWAQQQNTAAAVLDVQAPLWWATHLAAQQQQWDAVLTLCRLLDRPFMLSQRWGRWKQLWELGLTAARSMGDGAAEAYAFHQLGSRALCLGDFFTAHTYLTEATQRRIALRDEIGAAISQHNASLLYASDDQSNESHASSASSSAMTPNGTTASDGATTLASPTTRLQPPTIVSVPHPPPVAQGRPIDAAKVEELTRQIGTGESKPPASGSPDSNDQPKGQQRTQARLSDAGQFVYSSTQSSGTQSSGQGGPKGNGAIAPSSGSSSVSYSAPSSASSGSPTSPSGSPYSGTESASSRKITPTPQPSVTQPDTPPKVYAVTEARSFPIGWIAVALVAAVCGGLGAFLALTWNRTPFTINPRSVSFTPQLVNTESSRRGITVTNTSRETIELSSIAFSQGDRFDFNITDQSCTNRPLRPNMSCTIGLVFSPQESSARSTVLRLADATGKYVRSIQVRGLGESAQISFQPDGLSFPKTFTGGDERTTQTISVINDSGVAFVMGAASITGEREDAFAIGQDNCKGRTLGPNESCSVEVVFVPSSTGTLEANFAIRVASEDRPRLTPLIGIGELSAPELSASTLSFGDEVLGETATQRVYITNTGGSTLTIGSAGISGNTTNFRVQGDSCSRASLEPGQGCQVTVGFTPQAEQSYSAALVIQDNAVDGPRSVALTGRGSRVASPDLSPNPLTFGEQEVGSSREEQVTLINRSSRSLRVQSASLSASGDFSIVNDQCSGRSIAPGARCTLTVRFTPREMGDRSATLTIRDTATGSPRTVNITGTGAMIPNPQILSMEASPTNIRLGERANVCYRAVNAESLSLRSSTGQRLSLDNADGCVTVTPSETTTYTLTAEGRNGRVVTQQAQIQVAVPEPDTTPPPVPSPIGPSGNDYVLCAEPSTVALSWTPVTDESEPVTYTAVLERGSAVGDTAVPVDGWVPVTQQNTQATQVNITPFLQRGRVSYRWRVAAQDAEGNRSNVSPWANFRTCD